MQYKCIRGAVTSSGPVAVGSVVALPDYEARVLMAQGKFIPHAEEEVRYVAPVVEHRDPVAPAKRGRPRNGG
jgi:cystathionine beta-lyase family protein involved in aluminum resistance